MLVYFDSDVGSISMFGDVAVKLLKLMGHSGTVPSAILAEDIPAALARLDSALEGPSDGRDAQEHKNADAEEADKGEAPVSLKRRAHPLIDLLTRAAQRNCDVTWR
ncbi:MAG: DUF1840 domain-containing protein [Burkholderiales bacterium]